MQDTSSTTGCDTPKIHKQKTVKSQQSKRQTKAKREKPEKWSNKNYFKVTNYQDFIFSENDELKIIVRFNKNPTHRN